MTNFITLLVSLSECSEFKPNYHTRAKLKAFPLNCCNPSPDKRAAALPFAVSPPVFKQQHISSQTTPNQPLIMSLITIPFNLLTVRCVAKKRQNSLHSAEMLEYKFLFKDKYEPCCRHHDVIVYSLSLPVSKTALKILHE